MSQEIQKDCLSDPRDYEYLTSSSTLLQFNLPLPDLIESRDKYLQLGVPLYEASIKCDWNTAKAILDKYPELVRCSITEKCETALHVAASANGPKKVEQFVKNLVGRMERKDLELVNKDHNTALYMAAAAGNTETVKIMVEKNRALPTIPGGGGQIMPLYVAAIIGDHKVAKYLYDKSHGLREDGWTNANRGRLLEKCVESDMFDIAIEIVNNYPMLGKDSTLLGILARKPKAFQEKKSPNIIEMTIIPFPVSSFLVREPEKETEALKLLKIIWGDIVKLPKKNIDNILRGPAEQMKSTVQDIQLKNLISLHLKKMETDCKGVNQVSELETLVSQHVMNLQLDTQNIIKEENKTLYGKGDQALELQKLISEHIVKLHDDTQMLIMGRGSEEDRVRKLHDLITNQISSMRESTNLKARHSSRVVFVAAKMGNTKFLVELIRGYPDLIWQVNDSGVSIFHTAVKHRQEDIYNLLYEIGAMKNMITPLKDKNGNNMLHLVGKNRKQSENVSGGALEMQEELLWFREVESILPPSYRERRNNDGLTPHELFSKEHKSMVTQGEKQVKEIATQCMVVAALVATMVFAAAFTVPGGYDQNNGIPIFYSKTTFKVFVVADAISLLSSSASILYMFLSVFTSRYAERDFLESVPRKLMIGMSFLFLSMTTMIIAFSVSFFVLYQKGLLWIPIIISVFALIPFGIFIKAQCLLFIDMIHMIYGKYIFKRKKYVLYYENPTV